MRADLYSLGCTLYHLISGAAPFSRCSGTYEKLCAHREQRPSSLCEVVENIPEGLSQIVDRLLEKDPANRFETPAELLSALRPYCADAELLKAFPNPEMLKPIDVLPLTHQITPFENPAVEQTSRSERRTLVRSKLFWGGGLLLGGLLCLLLFLLPQENSFRNQLTHLFVPSHRSLPVTKQSKTDVDKEFVLMFDGVDDAIDTGFYYDSGKPITFELWFTPLSTTDRRKKELVCNAEAAGISLSIKEDANLKFQVHEGDRYVPIETLNCITNAQKMHVAAVYSGVSVQLYINGIASGAAAAVRSRHRPSPLSVLLGANPDPALLGREHASLRNSFRGIIHQFRISRGTRYLENFTPAEILAADETSELVYHLNGGEEQIVPDLSGNEHHGTILGGTWIPQNEFNIEDEIVTFSWPSGTPDPALAPLTAEQAQLHQQAWASFLKIPVAKNLEVDGYGSIEFILVPPGEFLIGNDIEEQNWLLNSGSLKLNDFCREQILYESPQHTVQITKPFYISKCETTQQQYRAFCNETGHQFPINRSEPSDSSQPVDQLLDAQHYPITNVTWNDAQAYCEWLSRKSESSASLPTEAQWEYACRAGTLTRWFPGDELSDLSRCGWHSENSGTRIHAVGQLEPNQWGLFDMHGNAAEWCQDYWRRFGYTSATRVDPIMRVQDSSHNIRGGSFSSWPVLCRSAARSFQQARSRSDDVGFRVILELPDKP